MIEEGAQAENFNLKDENGDFVNLNNYRGKRVVLFFYPKDDTPGCTKEACGFRDFYGDIQKTNTEILGISPDNPASHQRFKAKYSLPFTMLCDEDKKVMTAYQAWGEKTLYGRKSIGVIRSTVIIDEQGIILKHWKKVPNAQAHPEKVLQYLQSIS